MEKYPESFGEQVFSFSKNLLKGYLEKSRRQIYIILYKTVSSNIEHYDHDGIGKVFLRQSKSGDVRHLELEKIDGERKGVRVREFKYANVGLSESFNDNLYEIYEDGGKRMVSSGLDYNPETPIMHTDPAPPEERHFETIFARNLSYSLESGEYEVVPYLSEQHRVALLHEEIMRTTVSEACKIALRK